MRSNLFARLGFKVEKPVVTKKLSKKVSEELEKDREKLRILYLKDTIETAKMYHDIIPDDFIKEVLKHNDYLCVQWGGRKVARLLNICRNILDVEIITAGTELDEKDREHVLYLLIWMCWLFPIPLKAYLKMDNVEKHYIPIFKKWLIEDFNLLEEDELDLVLNGVFLGYKTKAGNPVLDIFHDALKFEDAQFDMGFNVLEMRTNVGKLKTFKIKTQRDSRANLTPHWLFHFQDHKGVTGLVDKEKSLEDEEYAEKDGISE